jgi:hypothetical protein
MIPATELAALGYPVFPCLESKAPACPGGFKSAKSDPAGIAELWRRYPGPLVGIPTGEASGLAVLDLDAKHPEARKWWQGNQARLPLTRTLRTRSGGLHLYFRHSPGLLCSVSKIAVGVDVRANGGYVIGWHLAGLPVLCDGPLADWPEWFVPPERQRLQRVPEPSNVPVDKRAGALLRVILAAKEGERNSCLFWAACRMAELVQAKQVSASNGRALLIRAGMDSGLTAIEAERTVKSAFAALGF